jgi:hypothetical protein
VPGRILSEADRLEEFARRATSMYFRSVAAKLGSGATTLHREAILSGKASRTSLTRGFTGRLARGIHNQLLEEMNRPGVAVLPYPLQRALMRNLAVPAQQAGRMRSPSLMGRPKCWTCPISRRSNASAIARQWSIRETCLMLGWSTPTGLWIVSFC